jgi:hypothetical protein
MASKNMMNHYRRPAWKASLNHLKVLITLTITSATGLMGESGSGLPPPGFRRLGTRF